MVPVGHGPPTALAQGLVSLGLLGFGRSMSSRIHILNQPLSCLRVFVWSTTETKAPTGGKNSGCPASREEVRPELLISRSQLLAAKQ